MATTNNPSPAAVPSLWGNISPVHRNLFRLSVGYTTLFYGRYFGNTILFFHALAETGGPLIYQSVNEMQRFYTGYKEQLAIEAKNNPQLRESERMLVELLQEEKRLMVLMSDLTSQFRNGQLTEEKYEQQMQAAKQKMIETLRLIQKCGAIKNIFLGFLSAVNPDALQSTLNILYQTLVVGFSAVSNHHIGVASMGMQMGRTISDRLSKVVFRSYATTLHDAETGAIIDQFVTTNSKWLQLAVSFIAQACGVYFAYKMDTTLSIITACSLGSDLVVSSLEVLLDPILKRNKLPTFQNTPIGGTILQGALFALGLQAQLFSSSDRQLPFLAKMALSPILGFEFYLNTVAANKTLTLK